MEKLNEGERERENRQAKERETRSVLWEGDGTSHPTLANVERIPDDVAAAAALYNDEGGCKSSLAHSALLRLPPLRASSPRDCHPLRSSDLPTWISTAHDKRDGLFSSPVYHFDSSCFPICYSLFFPLSLSTCVVFLPPFFFERMEKEKKGKRTR